MAAIPPAGQGARDRGGPVWYMGRLLKLQGTIGQAALAMIGIVVNSAECGLSAVECVRSSTAVDGKWS